MAAAATNRKITSSSSMCARLVFVQRAVGKLHARVRDRFVMYFSIGFGFAVLIGAYICPRAQC
jgi:hypothetical protein